MHESDLSSAVRAAKKRKTAKSRSERIVFVAVFDGHRQHVVPFEQHRLQRAPIAI